MELQTFKAWSASGFLIRKGAKAVSRNEFGEAVFSREQVTPKPASSTGLSRRRRSTQFYAGDLRGEQAHYSIADVDYEADRDSPWYDDAYSASWGLD